MNTDHPVFETNHSSWQQTCIQVVGATSSVGLIVSISMAQRYGLVVAGLGLAIGNVLLWAAAQVIIYMSELGSYPKNTLENASTYVGWFGGLLVALVLLFATFGQFTRLLTEASDLLLKFFGVSVSTRARYFIQIGSVLGILSTLGCLKGIKWLKHIAVWAFPILAIVFLIVIVKAPTIQTTSPIELDNIFTALLTCVLLVLGAGAAIIVDYPTFLRHSRSRRSARLAVTNIQILTFGVSIGGLFLGRKFQALLSSEGLGSEWLQESWLLVASVSILVVGACVVTNITNVYSASIGWEAVAPFFASPKEYLIIGLVLTLGFPWVSGLFSLEALNRATDAALIVLCAVVLSGFVIRTLLKKPPSRIETGGYLLAWIGGTLIAIIGHANAMANHLALSSGVVLSVVVSFLVGVIARARTSSSSRQ